jgi:hypothetical protein
MRFPNRLICAAMLIVAASMAHAEESGEEKYALHKLLDTQVSVQERQAIFDHVKEQAAAGKTGAQYVVGSLYRIGKKLDANVVDSDMDAAKKYLSIAAAHGRLLAMAKMAEIELASNRPMEAMIWTQLYGHYKDELEPGEKGKPITGYFADLLHRVQSAFDQKQSPQMQQYLGGFIAQHDADIRAGYADAQALDSDGSKTESRVQNLHYESNVAKLRNVKEDEIAEYVVAFDAHGVPQRLWLLDAVPDVLLGKELRAVATHIRVNETTSSELRYAVVPIDYSFGSFAIRRVN